MNEANGVLVTIGHGGWTVKKPNEHREDGSVSSTGRITGHSDDGWEKHVPPGTPIVDSRTVPEDKLLKWALHQPLVNPDLKGVRGVKVEQDFGPLGEEELDRVKYMHPTFQSLAYLTNLSDVSVEEFVKLSKEWGCTVTYFEACHGS